MEKVKYKIPACFMKTFSKILSETLSKRLVPAAWYLLATLKTVPETSCYPENCSKSRLWHIDVGRFFRISNKSKRIDGTRRDSAIFSQI
jgi:hypothetical protein